MPRVSVLMSNYRTPVEYLKKALESIFSQTMQDFEIIAINDGIVDESTELLYQYAAEDGRLKIFENEKNIGLAASLNRGLKLCSGEYIARMDTDDICLPNRLEDECAFMDSDPDLLFCGAWADIFSDDENVIVKSWQPKMPAQDEYHIRLLFMNDPLMVHPTVMFRRSLLEENGLEYDTDIKYRYSEDYRMWVKCSRAGKAGILEKTVLKYRNMQSDSRITVRHSEEMKKCSYNVQKEQFSVLGIDLTETEFEINNALLMGRKPYDISYKNWICRIISANKKTGIYNHKVLKKLLHERWLNIVYYGIAYEKSFLNKIKLLFSIFPSDFGKFIKMIIK